MQYYYLLYIYLLGAVGLRIGQIWDGIMVKHGELKYEVNSYTSETNPQGKALISGSKFKFISIPSFYFLLWGTSMPSQPSTMMSSRRGTKTARVSQPIGWFPDTAETRSRMFNIVDLVSHHQFLSPAPTSSAATTHVHCHQPHNSLRLSST